MHLCQKCSWDGTCGWVPPGRYRLYRAEAYGHVYGEQEMIAEIYARGPIACSIDSLPDPFDKNTGGGIIEPKIQSNTTDHVVVLTGFGVTSDTKTKFWSGRNSWGTAWGEDGWFRI